MNYRIHYRSRVREELAEIEDGMTKRKRDYLPGFESIWIRP